MGRLSPHVAALRSALRSALAELPKDSLVLVACSGGADSLALAATAAFVGPRHDLRVGLVTVDHGLQEGSAEQAAAVVKVGSDLALSPAIAVAVEVSAGPGPEAAARDARYAALDRVADEHDAAVILLAHTRDDQAETVLLALARGSGPRGIAGMPVRRGRYLRPFLDVPRETTQAACADLELEPWVDPHNSDPAFARVRVRELLPVLEEALGPGVVANLARTASLVAADTSVLDLASAEALVAAMDDEGALRVETLLTYPGAIRTRVLHGFARALGATPAGLSSRHVDALDALVVLWSGQGAVFLPGGIEVARVDGRLAASKLTPKLGKSFDMPGA